jgi:hypothetical protein
MNTLLELLATVVGLLVIVVLLLALTTLVLFIVREIGAKGLRDFLQSRFSKFL